jgi:hypothetical protein
VCCTVTENNRSCVNTIQPFPFVSWKHAREQAYGRIHNLVIPNMFYRTDIGDRWRKDADLLFSWGYLRQPF